MRVPTICLLAAFAASPAAAEAMKVGDLGSVSSRQACMTSARTVLEQYLTAHGGLTVTGEPEAAEGWSIYGWALRPGDNDVVIMCPIVAGQPHAFYAIHADGERAVENADTAAGRIRELWDGLR
jgi:hypothetical protein